MLILVSFSVANAIRIIVKSSIFQCLTVGLQNYPGQNLFFKKILQFSACVNAVHEYAKCSKILNTFLFLFSNKIMVSRAGIHKIFVRIAKREDPDQTAS